jgi:uncharacterized protein YxjI
MLNYSKYLVKERVAFLKLSDTYDIFDPATGMQIGIAREKPPSWVHLLRFLVNKRLLPTSVEIKPSLEAAPILTIKRGFTLIQSKIMVHDGAGKSIGYFKSKFFSLGGGFFIFDTNNNKVAEIKGDWKGWNFQLLTMEGKEIGAITRKWAGIGKELFTSADNYIISINDAYAGNQSLMALLLAAGLAIDIVFKEK